MNRTAQPAFSSVNRPVPETNRRSSKKDPIKLPPALEISIIIAQAMVVFTALLTVALSLLVKASWLDIIIRAAVAVIVVGLLGWLLSFLVGRAAIEMAVEDMEVERKKREEAYKKAMAEEKKRYEEALKEQQQQLADMMQSEL
jgi:hypothetical protein